MHNTLTKIAEYVNSLKGTHAQEGEDKVLETYFKNKEKGFYIDIGACHPVRFSNTYLFYKRGWNGINIDANPGSMKLFGKYRPRDINIEAPISNSHKKINYYIFDEPALNSFSSDLSKFRADKTKYKILKIVKLKFKKLSEILDEYLVEGTEIDFMSVDVEGYEYEVLSSNNWNKYKPTYLLVEILDTELEKISKNKVYLYLRSKNYRMIKKIGRTTLFKRGK